MDVLVNPPLSVSLWFVARTIAHTELRLREYFQKAGVECFIPTRMELLKRRGEMVEVEVPLISNLVFFKADYALAHSLFNLNGRRLYRVRTANGMLNVPDRQMEPFMRFVTENYGKVRILDPSYAVGDRVVIKRGPLAGQEGRLVKIDNRNHFTVSLDGLLVAAVRMPKSELAKVQER